MTKRSDSWQELQKHFDEVISKTHLRDLLQDQSRNSGLLFSHGDILLDLSHERLNLDTLGALQKFSDDLGLIQRIKEMQSGVSSIG